MDILPTYGSDPGMWVEVTVPNADLTIDGDTRYSPQLQKTLYPRFYYSQVLWVDKIQQSENGEILYHLVEKFGSYGDKFWADARAFKPITPEDISPIRPEVEEKYNKVDVDHQTMSCFENGQEILFTRVSTGDKHDFQGNFTDKYLTPPGEFHAINRKYISYTWQVEMIARHLDMRNLLSPGRRFLPLAALPSIPHIFTMNSAG
jgi:hypothetical protein